MPTLLSVLCQRRGLRVPTDEELDPLPRFSPAAFGCLPGLRGCGLSSVVSVQGFGFSGDVSSPSRCSLHVDKNIRDEHIALKISHTTGQLCLGVGSRDDPGDFNSIPVIFLLLLAGLLDSRISRFLCSSKPRDAGDPSFCQDSSQSQFPGLQRVRDERMEGSSCPVLEFPVLSSLGAHGDSPDVPRCHTWMCHTEPPEGPGDSPGDR